MDWDLRSDEAMARAGYRFRGAIPCPHCSEKVWIYQKLDQMPVFLDGNYWPHLIFDHNPIAGPEIPVDGKSAASGRDL